MCENSGTSERHSIQNGHADTNDRYRYSKRSTYAQILVTMIQNCLLIEIGLDVVMPTLVIGALHNSPTEELQLNDDQASWIGALPDLCHPFASLLSGYFQELLGRKTAMMIVTIPTFGAWIMLHFASSVYFLYAVAVILGLSVGLDEAPVHSYIGEIAEPHLRGTLSTISVSASLTGAWLMFVFIYFFDWRTVALICSVFPIITFTLMTQIPESPTWLLLKNRPEAAWKALCWLRGWAKPEEVEQEFQALTNYVKKSVVTNYSGRSAKDEIPSEKINAFKMQLKGLTSKKVLLPFRLQCMVFAICTIGYFSAIRPYLIGELRKMGTPIDAKLVLIASQALLVVGSMMNMVFLRRLGKRRIALFSMAIISFSMVGIGIHYSYLKGSQQFPQLAWLPVIFWLTICFVGGFSVALLGWQLLSEVFPIQGRGIASGICVAWTKLVVAILTKSYLYIEAWIDLSGIMYLYGALAILGFLYLYLYLPETEGKPLEHIESYFTKNHDRKEKFSIGKRANLRERITV